MTETESHNKKRSANTATVHIYGPWSLKWFLNHNDRSSSYKDIVWTKFGREKKKNPHSLGQAYVIISFFSFSFTSAVNHIWTCMMQICFSLLSMMKIKNCVVNQPEGIGPGGKVFPLDLTASGKYPTAPDRFPRADQPTQVSGDRA